MYIICVCIIMCVYNNVCALVRSTAAVMSWDSYISSLTKSEWVDDAVIIGIAPGQESVWASAPGGWLSGVTVRHSPITRFISTDSHLTLLVSCLCCCLPAPSSAFQNRLISGRAADNNGEIVRVRELC